MSRDSFNAGGASGWAVHLLGLGAVFALAGSVAGAGAEFSLSKAQASVAYGFGFRRPIKILIEGATAPVTLGFSGLVLGTTTTQNHIVPVAGLLLSPTCQIGSGGWSGLTVDSGPVRGNFVAGPQTVTYKLNGVAVGTFVIGCGREPTVDIARLTSDYSFAWITLPETLTITLSLTAGVLPVFIEPRGGAEPPPVNPLAELEGKEICIPFTGSPGKNVLGVGGVNSDVYGDAGGVGVVRFKVPPNWDGIVTFNGQPAVVASTLWSEFGPNISGHLIGSLYQEPLPAGMTRWNPSSPLVLPPGMTAGTALALPSGVTMSGGGMVGGVLNFDSTAGGVTRNFSVEPSKIGPSPSTGAASYSNPTGGTTPGGVSGAVVDDGAAIGMAASSDDIEKAAFKAPPGAEVGDSVGALRESLIGKFAALGPLAPGSIGRTNLLPFELDCGRFGLVKRDISFSNAPFPQIRVACLVVFTMVLFLSFVRKLVI